MDDLAYILHFYPIKWFGKKSDWSIVVSRIGHDENPNHPYDISY